MQRFNFFYRQSALSYFISIQALWLSCALSRNSINCIVIAHEIYMGSSTSILLKFGTNWFFAYSSIHSYTKSIHSFILKLLIKDTLNDLSNWKILIYKVLWGNEKIVQVRKVVIVAILDKVTVEDNWRGRVSCVQIWRNSILRRREWLVRNSNRRVCLVLSRNSKEASVAEKEWEWGEGDGINR